MDGLKENNEVKDVSRKNILALGWVAFFGGLSQNIISPILPTFYAQILGYKCTGLYFLYNNI